VPLYEYRCGECDAAFESLVPAARADEVACAHCEAPRARRLLSVFSAPRATGSDGAAMPTSCCGGGCGSC
jgi:putative FmdB family regulatory protein